MHVINCCWECKSPVKKYSENGIKEYRIDVLDHCLLSIDQLNETMQIIKKIHEKKEKFYVHCFGKKKKY